MSKKHTIEVTDKQLELLSMACEFTSRFICGQTGTFNWPYQAMHNSVLDMNDPNWCQIRDAVDKHMDDVKKLVWNMEPSAHYGVGFHPDSDTLWDMYTAMRHELWKMRNPNGSENFTVDSRPPMECGPEPLISIKTDQA